MTRDELAAWVGSFKITTISKSNPWGPCAKCGAESFYARHPEGRFDAMVPACRGHEAAADAMLRDPGMWVLG